MLSALVSLTLALLVVVIVLQVRLLRRPALDLTPLSARLDSVERAHERTERMVREEFSRNREEAAAQARALREELAQNQARQTEAVAGQLKYLQETNTAKLEQIRRTVDEQLQGTLEKRLGESFQLVSQRLEQVYRGLGEMQSLATGVGDLKKVLGNVKARGTWGEVSLGTLLEEILTPDQYERNVPTTGTNERVEFAIRLPGAAMDIPLWLPVDAKFPQEDYLRLVEASERGDAAEVEVCSKQLQNRICNAAKEIHSKYIAPPFTTDFAFMYLPTEGLYAEVLRRPGLVEQLQREYRVNIAGPSTIAAFLNSIRLGFRSLAIQQRSSEVWELLGAVKTEFGKYGDVLSKLKKKLEEAANTVDSGLTRTRVIQRKLRDVEVVPEAEVFRLIPPDEETETAAAAAE